MNKTLSVYSYWLTMEELQELPFPSAESKLTEEHRHERKQNNRETPRAVLFNHKL